MPRLCHDLVVIGSGPAGQKAALSAAKLGKRVAIVDRTDSIGGVCIHTGTVPSKAIREAVLHLTGLRERSVYGDSYAVKQTITMDDLLYRCRHVVRTEVEVIRSQMSRNGVTMLYGCASFADAETVRVQRDDETTEVKASHVLVATGTNPARPANVPFMPGVVIDSDELLTLPRLPRSLSLASASTLDGSITSAPASGNDISTTRSKARRKHMVDTSLE